MRAWFLAVFAVLCGAGMLVGTVAGTGCSAGDCGAGRQRCAGQCVDLQADPDHCGACASVCDPSQVCSLGRCSDGCAGGLAQCGRSCVDLQRDPSHCGDCDRACAPDQTCVEGRCSSSGPDGGTNGDGAGVDAVGDDAGPPPCSARLSVTTSGSFDLDLIVHQLSGRVTKNGQRLPQTTLSHRGRIEFVDGQGATLATPRLQPGGEASYQTEILAGTYDVYYAPLASDCEDPRVLPCHAPRVLLRRGVDVNVSGSLDLDIPVHQLSGRVTKNGQRLPQTTLSHRGRIEFVDDRGATLATPRLQPEGEASYQTEIVAGTYDVYYAPLASDCEDPRALPCHAPRVLLRQGVTVSASGALDLDLVVHQLSGRVTKNGQRLPQTTLSHRGRIEFVDGQGATLATPRLQPGGEASYQTEIVAGTYDVYYAPLASDCEDPRALPCHAPRVLLRRGVAVNLSGSLDLDIPVALISGRVTRNGQRLPETTRSHRGRIEFVDDEGATLAAARLQPGGEASYQTEIVAGTYDVYYAPLASDCDEPRALPCHAPRVLLRRGVTVNASGSLDLDLVVHQLSGRVTKNGQRLPQTTLSHRGRIEFVDDEGATLAAPRLQPGGEARYQTEIVAGTYDVYYAPLASDCDEPRALPCHAPRVLIHRGLDVNVSGSFDLDIPVHQLSGRVTKNGQRLPETTLSHRGRIELVDVEGATLTTPRLDPGGEARYQTEIVEGSYDIYYAPLASDCDEPRALPCHAPRVLLKGCGAPLPGP